MNNLNIKDEVEIIKVDCLHNKNCVNLRAREKEYITRKICNMPTVLPKQKRKVIGRRIIRKLWGDEIQGDMETIKW